MNYRESIKKLSLTERTQLNTPTNKCISNGGPKPDYLMYTWITQMIGCNLAWISSKNESQEICQTNADYEAYFKATHTLQKRINDLPPECMQTSWTLTNFFEERDRNHPTTEYMWEFLGQDLRVTIEEENYQYGFTNFIGDFGGYLGLFLGGSFIGIFEIFEDFMKKIRQRKSVKQSG